MASALILQTARIRLQPAMVPHLQMILLKLRPKLPRSPLAPNLPARLLASQQQKTTLYETLQTSFALLDRMSHQNPCLDQQAWASRNPYPPEMSKFHKLQAPRNHSPQNYRSRFRIRQSPLHLSLKVGRKGLEEPHQSYKPANPLLATVTQPLS